MARRPFDTFGWVAQPLLGKNLPAEGEEVFPSLSTFGQIAQLKALVYPQSPQYRLGQRPNC